MNGTRFNAPRGICVAPSGDVLISDSSNHTLRTWVVATGAVTTLAGAAGMQGSGDGTGTAARFFLPQGLAADSSGNLFVAEPGNQTIRKFAMATGVVTTLAGLANAYGSAVRPPSPAATCRRASAMRGMPGSTAWSATSTRSRGRWD